ncbi:MAG: pyridoxal phosphate-dependent aminotransferase [Planctomycetota bacterium]|nr:pyridoxal phosphate-dependent aminotransferase [Planctomycetota bacterium]
MATDGAPDPFPYLRWAKAHLSWTPAVPTEISLGMSGVAPLDAETRAALGLAPPPDVGGAYARFAAALVARYGVTTAQIHPAAGTSHANYVTYLALAGGGRIAAEAPAYEALHCLAPAVGATLTTFTRDPARAWRIDPASLARSVADGVDLLVVTDLHNPSGARLHPEDLALLIDAAHAADAYVLVDEVYADFDPEERPSAVHADARVLVTNSLTKVHGLPDLRAGWILGAPAVIRRIDAHDDLVHPALPPAPMADAATYVPQARARLAALRVEAAARAAEVDAWVRSIPDVSWTLPDGGLTGLVRLHGRDGDRVAARAWTDHGVRVVPGSFFQTPDSLRLSFLLPPDQLARALQGLRAAIEACS